MSQAWLALGANMDDAAAQIDEALNLLGAESEIRITRRSKMIVSEPWGKTDQNHFHNMVIEVETTLQPVDLLDACLTIENSMGRIRTEKWGPRLIDIDVIAYDREIIKSERLTLPHPFAHERDFVQNPLREIAPEIADWIEALSRH